VTWVYRPGTFTPLTQSERVSASEDPQQVIDQRFYAIITDQLGTPAELVSATGAVVGLQRHTLWGGTLWHPGGASTPLRFPGQYHDPETGLHYNHQRYYDPVTGGYLTPDGSGDIGRALTKDGHILGRGHRASLCRSAARRDDAAL